MKRHFVILSAGLLLSTMFISAGAAADSSGDLNLDQLITVADAILLARMLAEDSTAQVTEAGLANADVNGDGTLNALDTTALLKMISNN